MPNTAPSLQHLIASADAERARYRELCSVICERIRQYAEENGRYPRGLAEITGAEPLRQMVSTSDRIEAIAAVIDAWQEIA